MFDKLKAVESRYEEIGELLMDGAVVADQEQYKKLMKEHKQIHLADIEKILDEVIFLDKGKIIINEDADALRKKEKASIDEVFRRRMK